MAELFHNSFFLLKACLLLVLALQVQTKPTLHVFYGVSIILTCRDAGSGKDFTDTLFFNASDGTDIAKRDVANRPGQYIVDIPPENETAVVCLSHDSNNESSDPLNIFAIRQDMSSESVSICPERVIESNGHGEFFRLPCDYRPGRLRDTYVQQSWTHEQNGGSTIIVTNTTDYRIENDYSLIVRQSRVSSGATFYCTLKIERCADSNNASCNIQFYQSRTLITGENILSVLRVTGPGSKNITKGQTITFTCTADAPNLQNNEIAFRWTVGESKFECGGDERCSMDNNFHSTLELDTKNLLVGLYTVNCTAYVTDDGPDDCHVKSGITGSGSLLVMTANCISGNPICHQNATCRDNGDGFMCVCNEQFLGNGIDCTEDSSNSDTYKFAVAVGTIGGVVVLVILANVILVILCAQKKSKTAHIEQAHVQPLSLNTLRGVPGVSRIEETNKIISHSRIRLLDRLGEGEYGIVYKAHLIKDVRSTAEIVAVKTLKQCYDMEGNSKIIQESLRMIGLDHPNVLGLVGVCVDAGPTPYLVLPYMGHGNLLSYLKKRRSKLVCVGDSEEDADKRSEIEKKLLGMCLQISRGMEYLASKNLVHRDLAARNCMMDLNNVIKVADFGLTEAIYTKKYFRQCKDISENLPVKWMAPESLSDYIFSEASDVWSFGVTCWEVYSGGRIPYPGIHFFTLQQELAAGRRMDRPLNAVCSDEIYEIMLTCWNDDPSKRPTFSKLVVTFTTLLEELAGYMDFSALKCDDEAENEHTL